MKLVDLTAQRFGRLLVKERAPNRGRKATWLCVCDCGSTTIVLADNLRVRPTQSCGCLGKEISAAALRARNTTHGHTKAGGKRTSTYGSWRAMRYRCTSPSDSSYKRYGAQGITVCERWAKFETFLADMGERPAGMTLDRIDNAKGYSPENCRWATYAMQVANRSRTSGWKHAPARAA